MPRDRDTITGAFGVPVTNMFATTEGLVGHSEPGGDVLTFASDTCIAECADEANRPVAPGTPSAKVLVTNLHNLTQPLIRYELTDQFTPAGPAWAAGCGPRLTAVRTTSSAMTPLRCTRTPSPASWSRRPR